MHAAARLLEVTYKVTENQSPPWPAAAQALQEVRGGLVTANLTTVSVLVPVFFLTGLAQRLFQDFAVTLIYFAALYPWPRLCCFCRRSWSGWGERRSRR